MWSNGRPTWNGITRLTVSPTFLTRVWRRFLGSQILGRSVKEKDKIRLKVESSCVCWSLRIRSRKKKNSRIISLMVTGWASLAGALGPAMLWALTLNCSLSPVVRFLTISDVLSVRPSLAGIHSSAASRNTTNWRDGAWALRSRCSSLWLSSEVFKV